MLDRDYRFLGCTMVLCMEDGEKGKVEVRSDIDTWQEEFSRGLCCADERR